MHQKVIKLADFGLSRKIAEVSSNASKMLGLIPYMDPKFLRQRNNYKFNKKSDVYSVGVLMWQISSGYRPFHIESYDIALAMNIVYGQREEIINETPNKYSNLYQGNDIFTFFTLKKRNQFYLTIAYFRVLEI